MSGQARGGHTSKAHTGQSQQYKEAVEKRKKFEKRRLLHYISRKEFERVEARGESEGPITLRRIKRDLAKKIKRMEAEEGHEVSTERLKELLDDIP